VPILQPSFARKNEVAHRRATKFVYDIGRNRGHVMSTRSCATVNDFGCDARSNRHNESLSTYLGDNGAG